MRITIEFCVVWNYTPRATSLVETLINTFKPFAPQRHPIEEIILLPSGGGRFEVTIDGELVYSKAATGMHPSNDAIIEMVRNRLKSASK